MNTIIVLANEWFPVIKVLCIIGAVVAFFVSLYQWRRGQRIRKSEFLSELMAKFTSSEIATTYYEYIERKTKCFYKGLSSEGEPEFISEEDERAVDRLLGFMSYVCYLYENRLIDKNEFSLFVYQMNAVLSDEDIRRYMADLRGCLPANYPYEYLARYVERCDLRQTSKNSAPSPTTSSAPVGELTMAKFIDYLVSAFGGMTASAQSVKARAETVRKQLGLSLDNMVKDEASTQRTLERIDAEMTDKNYNVRANLKNAVRHCYQAKYGKRFGTSSTKRASVTVAVSAIVICLTLGAFANTETIDGYTWTYSVKDGTACIYKYYSAKDYGFLLAGGGTAISPKPAGQLSIPSKLGGVPVERIGTGAFRGCSEMTSVVIPNGVKTIGAAFRDCTGLQKIMIPNSVTNIEIGAFQNCTDLRSLDIPDSVSSIEGCYYYDDCMSSRRVMRILKDCTALATVSLPDHLWGKVPRDVFPPQTRVVKRSDADAEKRLLNAVECGDAEAIAKFREDAAKSFMGFEFGSDIRYINSRFGASRTSDGHALRVTSAVNWPRFRKFTVRSLSDGCIYGSLKSGKMYRLERCSESFPDSATKEEKRAEFERTVNVIAKKYMVSPVRSKKERFLGLWHEEIAKFVVGQMEITLEWVNEDSMKLTAIHKGYEALAEKEWREDIENQDGADVL